MTWEHFRRELKSLKSRKLYKSEKGGISGKANAHAVLYTLYGNSLLSRPNHVRPPLKKTLFPVQRVAEIVASRAVAKSSFFPPFFLCVRKWWNFDQKNIFWAKWKKKFPFCSNIHTWPLDRKQYFFKGWPQYGLLLAFSVTPIKPPTDNIGSHILFLCHWWPEATGISSSTWWGRFCRKMSVVTAKGSCGNSHLTDCFQLQYWYWTK